MAIAETLAMAGGHRAKRTDRARFARALTAARRRPLPSERTQGRHGGELRHRADLGQLGRPVRGVQEALPRGRAGLQRHRFGQPRWSRSRRRGNRPQADTAYYFAASAVDAAKKGVVAPFKPVNFDKLPAVFRDPDGKSFTHPYAHRRLRGQHQAREERPAVLGRPAQAGVQEHPSCTSIRARPAWGRCSAFAANFANGGDMNNVQPGLDYLGKLAHSGNVLRVLGTTPTPSSSRARSRSGSATRTTASRPSTPTASVTPWRW